MNMKKWEPSSLLKCFMFFMALFMFVLSGSAMGLDLTVIGENHDGTTTELTEFRWLIEEDQTYHVDPGVPDPNTLAVSFHQSYMPVVAKGDETSLPTDLVLDLDKHYYVSVLPKAPGTYSIGGAQIAAGQDAVSISLNQLPLPTAQISIFVFEDNFPINNAPDLPEEVGIPGVQILVEDAGGKYGISAGAQMTDVFGNMLGTLYDQTCDASGQNPGTGDSICMAAEGPVCILDEATPAPDDCLSEPMVTDADGRLLIKNLAPGKYGIQAVPPAGYQQTTTIEGTKVIDAWVKAGEPPFFAEFGPPGEHVFIGFVSEFNEIPAGGTTSISGQVVNLHLSRPPHSAFYNGAPLEHTTAWVGLNDNAGLAGAAKGLYSARANEDGTFSIPNVPPGDYQLAVWDDNLDVIFAFHNVTVNADDTCVTPDGTCDLGEVPVFQWFTRLETHVFSDEDGDGVRDPGEGPVPETGVNLRWRDGTMYQSFPTDSTGAAPFDQVFPFFSWLVAEVDFARLKATGVTVTVDDGGPVAVGEHLKPQEQNNPIDPAWNPLYNSDFLQRTEVGPVLTQAFQGFLGQTSVMEWGKTSYGPGENGGISGMVYYAVTRAEDDPALAAAEPWEPGIPRVQVNLYQDSDFNGVPDDRNANGGLQLTDVDNYPFQWARSHQFLDDGSANPEWTGTPGPEDVDRNNNGRFNIGDAINITWTDSWDDSLPTHCQYGMNAGTGTDDPFVFRGESTDCFDGMRNWNQVRPGVFDGGYAFTHYYPRPSDGRPVAPWVAAGVETPLPSGIYIVEASLPNGYEHVKEEDRNVDFGDEYTPNIALTPALCVGDDHSVPAELTLFPGVEVGSGYGNTSRPLCDRKQVLLGGGANAVAEFFMFTEVPISAHIKGFILDDTANEWDPNSPQFGEKYAPPFLPVSIRDYTGREIGRTYSDEYGTYNALVPSTYTTNLPAPSGMSPNMLTTCMNDPVLPDGTEDPHFNAQYSTFCYTFQYMPGSTTYLDTPVVPVAAMAGPNQQQLDCEFPNGTPVIREVSGRSNGVGGGPYDPNFNGLIIRSVGRPFVPNPAYDGVGGTEPKLIRRDFRFGAETGQVLLDGNPVQIQAWNQNRIRTGSLPTPLAGERQLTVIKADGTKTVSSVTVTVGPATGAVHTVSAGQSIQDAIDAATAGDLILIGPGTYPEMVVLWKPVKLQGWGAASSIISAINAPGEKLLGARLKMQEVIEGEFVDLLPGQVAGFGGIEPDALFTEEGAGILVLAKNDGSFSQGNAARIDGLTVKNASSGGGIVVNGYASYLSVSNNRIINNHGTFGGGIRLGHPQLTNEVGGLNYTDAENDFIEIHNNHITQNGGLNGSGGGVSICTGSDQYQVVDNYICGNFTMDHGGGIGHLGASSGLIFGNTILFNENFNQGLTVSGGGISIAGQQPLPDDLLSPGAGSVIIEANVIQGNLAGAGDGGGINLNRVNGVDVSANPNRPNRWNRVDLINNIITNNVAGLAGAGIALQDSANVRMIFNTIANNDSTATASGAFSPADPNTSNPQPSGLVGRAHSTELAGTIGNVGNRFARGFSNPYLRNNIIWHNRSFYFSGDPTVFPPVYQLFPDLDAGEAPVYDDLGVLGINANMTPRYTVFSETYTGPGQNNATNIKTADAGFVFDYLNGGLGNTVRPGEPTSGLLVPAAFDEGGNFIQVRFGPLTTEGGDYHLLETSVAVDAGTDNIPAILGTGFDIDGESRRAGEFVDIGADEQSELF